MAGKNEAKVRFTAETEDLRQSIREANSDLNTLRAEMRLNEAQFKNTGDSAEYLTRKSELLQAELEANAQKQEALTAQLETAKTIFGEDSEEVARLERQLINAEVQEERLTTQLNDTNQAMEEQKAAAEQTLTPLEELQNTITQQEQELANLATEFQNVALEQGVDSDAAQELKGQYDELKGTINDEKQQLQDLSNALDDTSNAAEGGSDSIGDLSAMLAGAGIADTVKEISEAAIEMAESFDEANAAIVEGTGATGDALADLNQQAQEAFGRIADADQDLNGVSNILAALNTRLKLDGDALEDMTVKVSNFAQHTGTDGVNAVNDISNILQRWNMDVSEADGLMDDLTTANQSCQLSVDELSGYLSSNSIQFQERGYSTQDALAMLISLSDGGANVGSVMGAMKKAVQTLSQETDDVPGAFQDAITAIGNCGSVSEALQAKVGDTGKTVQEVFGARAAQEIASNILNGNFAIDQWTEALKNNDGALEQTTKDATTMSDSWSQGCNAISTAVGSALAPAISDVTSVLGNVLTSMGEAIQKSPALQAVVVALATVFGILAGALAIGGIITAVTAALGAMGAVIAVITSPIFIIIAAVAALVAGLIYAYNHCETFRNIVNTAFTAIKTAISTAMTVAGKTVTKVITTIKNTMTRVWNTVKRVTTTAWNAVKTGVSTAINAARSTVSSVVNRIRSVVTSAWNNVRNKTRSAFNAVKNAISTAVNGAKTTAVNVFNTIKNKITSTVNTIKTKVKSAFNAVKSAITTPLQNAWSTVRGILGKIKGAFPVSLGKILHFQLPKISVSAGSPPWGIGGKGKKPNFSVSWSSHAQGAVFPKPTLLPAIDGMHMVGDNRTSAEAVSPISVLQDYIGDAVRENVGTIDYDLLGQKVAVACSRLGITLKINQREFGRVVREVV